MNKHTHSIQTKILTRTLFVLLLLSITLGLTSVIIVQSLSKADSRQLILQKCEAEALRFDNKLNLVRHSVTMIYEYAIELESAGQIDILSKEFENHVKNISISVANDTDGAMAVYFRYNPLLTGTGTDGFFWSRKSADTVFTEELPTDILAYDNDDIEHVGWFYVPKETGEPLWMAPYYNKNLNVLMISYIIPLYRNNGEFIGVIGMDIDFNSIMNTAGSVKLYDTGRLALIDLSERIIYYCDENGNTAGDSLPQDLYDHVTTADCSVELPEITDSEGRMFVSCTQPISNGMLLYLGVPVSEINANRNTLMLIILIVTLIIGFIAVLLIRNSTSRLIRPIKKLAAVADNYACGKWEDKYICNTGDELQLLSESISTMADQTRDYLNRLGSLVRIDPMTGLQNRSGYMELTEEIRKNRHGRFDRYAVVVMDLNNLKKANDTHGHDVGDALIKESGRYICDSFRHSPVFRIGGDEFVAILLNEDYDNRFNLTASFENGMGYKISGEEFSLSWGMASPDEIGSDYEEVFKLADDRMYFHKAERRR
ncbi:MAG: diguanylate cyclase [Parasporobacterium sp.]|nr:diguanylate cyclase [Parasporobacterium sp.]